MSTPDGKDVGPKADEGESSRRRPAPLHHADVEIEHALALVALFLILLPELDDLFQDLHVEPFAFGLRKHFLFLLAQLKHFGVQIFDPGAIRRSAAMMSGFPISPPWTM
jgi:hypothetical protein